MKTMIIKLIVSAILIISILILGTQVSDGSTPTPRATPAEQPVPTSVFLPPTPETTPIATIAPSVIGPVLTVECSPDLECEAIVYPNTSTAFLVLAVDTEYLSGWEELSISDGWGVRLQFAPPACIGIVARIRLLEGEEGSPPNRPMPPLPVLASYNVAAYCSLLPLVSR